MCGYICGGVEGTLIKMPISLIPFPFPQKLGNEARCQSLHSDSQGQVDCGSEHGRALRLASSPGLCPDFISQLWIKSGRRPGNEATISNLPHNIIMASNFTEQLCTMQHTTGDHAD